MTESRLVRLVRESVIGEDHVMRTPYGERRVTYADDTESSGTGLQTTRLREDARRIIHEAAPTRSRGASRSPTS